LIFCLAREFEYEPNEILVRKAEKYRGHGVIGIDLAGPEQHTLELGGDVDRYRDLFSRARAAGLGTTVHTGETTHTGPEGVLAVIDKLKPARIGHGIAAAQSEEAMRKLVENGIVLELCPSSNLRTHAVADVADLRRVFDRLRDAGVRMTINTDGTYLLGTTLRKEFDLLLGEGIVSQAEARTYIGNARNASFIPR
ncbi:MAG: adenosine deaminase family protein, partial [Polyangia bacterium]